MYGWLSKLWPLFGYPKYLVPYYNRDPKRDHNFDNHPFVYVDVYIYIYTHSPITLNPKHVISLSLSLSVSMHIYVYIFLSV